MRALTRRGFFGVIAAAVVSRPVPTPSAWTWGRRVITLIPGRPGHSIVVWGGGRIVWAGGRRAGKTAVYKTLQQLTLHDV